MDLAPSFGRGLALAALLVTVTSCQECGGRIAVDTTAGGGQGGAEPPPYTLQAPVEIVRDTEGVVHVYGQSDADVFYADGYMQATDRLFQMDLQRRRSYGRLAEVLGEDKVGDDALIRTLGIPKWGAINAEAARSQEPVRYQLVRAWTAGVNARVAEVTSGAAPTPLGFTTLGYAPEPWVEEDAFVIGKAIVFSNGNQLEFDLLATLIATYTPDVYAGVPAYKPLVDAFILEPPAPLSAEAPDVGPEEGPFDRPRAAEPEPAPRRPSLPPDARERLAAFFDRVRDLRPGASNNWAVAPAYTDTGRSLIAGDPHQPLRSPSLMWLHHMSSVDHGGSLDIAGWSFVGTPSISIGHNRHLAWTATTNYPDVTDIFDLETDGEALARVGDAWVPIVSREETIDVKDGPPQVVVIDEVEGYGVLLPKDLSPLPLVGAGHRLLFQWTGYRVTREAASFFAFGQSKTTADFEAAVDTMELGSFNFVAASADAITYRSSPLVPDRGDPAVHPPSYRMLSASDPAALWTGAFLPPEKMPRALGTEPFIVTANNDPFGFTADGRLDNDPWYFGAYFDPGTRAGRARDRLAELVAAGPVTIADMQSLQSDTYSLLADEVLPQLAAAFAKVPTDDALAEFRDRPELDALMGVLTSWDRRMERAEPGAAAFQAVLHFYMRGVIEDDLSLFFDPVLGNSPTYVIKFALLAAREPGAPLLQEGKDLLLLRALSDTAALLQDRFGAVDVGYTWADAHETHFASESIAELDGGAFATDGAEGTVNVSEGQFFDGQEVRPKHVSRGGPIYRMTATFDEDGTPRAFFNMPRGASGEPGAPFWDTGTTAWVEDEYTLLRYQRADVDAAIAERMVLEP